MVPEYLTPWIYTHATAIVIELLLWLFDQWTGQDEFNLKIFIEFVFVYMMWVMVYCLQKAFILLLHKSQTNGYSLMTP